MKRLRNGRRTGRVCINYRIKWADNSKGPASLKVDNYAHREDYALDSWVQLVCKEDEASASNS